MGKFKFSVENNQFFSGVPTGAGKTLPQLGTILTMEGVALIIPPLVTIQQQMAKVCEAWKIPHINLSNALQTKDIHSSQDSIEPKVILASIEDLTNVTLQRYLLTLNNISYVAVDECQVRIYSRSPRDAFKNKL